MFIFKPSITVSRVMWHKCCSGYAEGLLTFSFNVFKTFYQALDTRIDPTPLAAINMPTMRQCVTAFTTLARHIHLFKWTYTPHHLITGQHKRP